MIDNPTSINGLLEYEYTSIYTPLEVEYALDVCGNYINFATEGEKILIVTHDEILLYKLLNRTTRKVHVFSESIEKNQLRDLIVSRQDFEEKTIIDQNPANFDIIIWMVKDNKVETKLKNLKNLLNPSGKLLLIFSNIILYDLKKNFRKIKNPKEVVSDLISTYTLVKTLKKEDIFPQRIYGFHHPQSVIYGRIADICKKFGREDLEDRFQYKLRETIATDSWQKYLSTLILIIAKRKSEL